MPASSRRCPAPTPIRAPAMTCSAWSCPPAASATPSTRSTASCSTAGPRRSSCAASPRGSPMRRLLAIGALALAIAGCEEEKPDRGIELLPDMYHTPAYKSQTAGRIEVDGRDAQGNPIRRTVEFPAMLAPPEGTVPRGFQPYPLKVEEIDAARAQHNPFAPTPAVLRQGQHDFLIYCATCHGRDGNASNG